MKPFLINENQGNNKSNVTVCSCAASEGYV